MQKFCRECGKPFNAKHRHAMFCSSTCRSRAYRHGRSGQRPGTARDVPRLVPPVADRPPLDADQQALRARIVAMRLTGGTLQAIARTLNLEESTAAAEITAALEKLASLQSGEVTHSGQLAMARLDAVEAQGWAVLRHAAGDENRPQDSTAMLGP